jgi:hypothetical protein
MSGDRRFALIGDSNVQRFLTQVNRRACPDLQTSQLLQCGRLPLLQEALSQVTPDVNTCIIACVSNFISSVSGSEAVSTRVDPAITKFGQILIEFCTSRSDVRVFVSPPMYRLTPTWYRDGMPEVLTTFSSIVSKLSPQIQILPSFPSLSFEKDGIHLTPYAGLEHIYHLFDSSKALLESSSLEVGVRCAVGQESSRVLGDRVAALEQDHRRLNQHFESKVAVDAELADFQENVRNEVFFVICGLPRISADLRGKDWQLQAVSDVKKVIQRLLGKDLPVVVVQNVTGRAADAEVRYHVKMEFAAHSQEVRSKFGSFFIGGKDNRPEDLKSVSISNRINQGSQIRLSILKLMAKKYLVSNPGSKVKVVGFEARPIIRITPPPETKKRSMTFTYIEAVNKLRFSPTPEELRPIVQKASSWFPGRLHQLFIVLPDDIPSLRRPDRQPEVVDQHEAGVSEALEVEEEVESDQVEEQASGWTTSNSRKRGHPAGTESRARKQAR